MSNLTEATRNKLKTISTATVATALFKRGLRVQCIQDVHPLNPDQPTLVGEAFTLRYMPAREDLNTLDAFRDRTHPQRAPRLRRGALLIRVHADWVPALRSSVARCTASGTRAQLFSLSPSSRTSEQRERDPGPITTGLSFAKTAGVAISATTSVRGYGSLLSQGRRNS